ncbi:MAG: alpha/beta fold hydrolase [Gammaproteobacteria bacterium]|nr:MAG: alpha/beta fold hydrolase [Gammaproteobacteria bacterium]
MHADTISHNARAVDRLVHATMGKLTGGMSPIALYQAWQDWASHASCAPGKQVELAENAVRNLGRVAMYGLSRTLGQDVEPPYKPLPQDYRFRHPSWQKMPWSFIQQSFLMQEQWWHYATTRIPGVSPRNENMVAFGARQILDMFSPTNLPYLNPEVLDAMRETKGRNFAQGVKNWLEDLRRIINNEPPVGAEQFKVGENLATTPGKVVYRNRLMELIQYSPSTKKVHPEPVLVVPAWIMKYYILDLSEHNSLVRWLVGQGHTVFIISWLNPGPEDRNLSMDDYREMGVMDALKAINAIVPDQKVHAAGYCLGGTILSIAAATMAREGDDRLASMTLIAAQTDFKEAGELMLFINESQLTFLEDIMWEQGYLDAKQMSGAFMMLRSKDLLWSRLVNEYLKGERPKLNDLMAWNADTTRMPYRMHSQYLRSLFLNNDLAEGRFEVDGRPIFLRDLRLPIFAVGATKDHVAPWPSVFKIRRLTSSPEVTFCLTKGGHNAGIISEPGHPRRDYLIHTRHSGDRTYSPEQWQTIAERYEGSWWLAWQSWLAQHSGPCDAKPPAMGNVDAGYAPLCDAPGTYVFQR